MTAFSKKYITAFAATAVLALGLYGCGGGGSDMAELDYGDGISLSPAAAVYANSSSDTLSSLLPDGNTTFAPVSAAVLRDVDGGLTSLPDEDEAYVASISSDDANGFRVTYVIDGVEHDFHFQDADWNMYEYYKNSGGVEVWLWSLTDSMYRGANRTSGSSEFAYFDMNGWLVAISNDGFEGYSTYGARTHADNMPMGSATYEGILHGRSWRGDNPIYPSGRTNWHGDLTLNVNFDNREVDGLVDNLRAQPSNFSAPLTPMREGNSLDISDGVIVNGQFSAEWVGVDTNTYSPTEYTVSGLAGTMAGEFYGPNAEEVGGVIAGYVAPIASNPDYNVVGVFGAEKQ